MRSNWLLPFLLLALNAVAAPAGRVEVIYVAPERFSDLRDGYTQTPQARAFFLDQLRRYIEQHAATRLEEGEMLRVTITDIRLAGDYEARTPSVTDVRIVREVTPARIDLVFRLTREDGAVVTEGERQLRSSGYPVVVGVDPSDPLVYEKALLDDWLAATFPRRR